LWYIAIFVVSGIVSVLPFALSLLMEGVHTAGIFLPTVFFSREPCPCDIERFAHLRKRFGIERRSFDCLHDRTSALNDAA
jgi:hypothetical protein